MSIKERKTKQVEPTSLKTEVKVAGGAGAVAVAQLEEASPDFVFVDRRSGRDRREEQGRTYDSRRVSGERRRSHVTPSFWWLEKNYVDSHQFSMVTPEDASPAQLGGTRYT